MPKVVPAAVDGARVNDQLLSGLGPHWRWGWFQLLTSALTTSSLRRHMNHLHHACKREREEEVMFLQVKRTRCSAADKTRGWRDPIATGGSCAGEAAAGTTFIAPAAV